MENVYLRPVNIEDLDSIMELIKTSGPGLTNLPKDRSLMEKKISWSVDSFSNNLRSRKSAFYFFCLVNTKIKKIIGVSGIISQIAVEEPYYFNIIRENNEGKYIEQEVIEDGPAEVCSIYLHPDHRVAQNGKLLSLSRLLFIAQFKQLFPKSVIAEMRGVVSDEGTNPFWDALGARLTKLSFLDADAALSISTSFVKEKLPKYKIDIDSLPEAAQEVIAQVHGQTLPAKKILEKEGLKFINRIGILEPGPVLESDIDNLRAVKELKTYEIDMITKKKPTGKIFLLSTHTDDPAKFKSCCGTVKKIEGKLIIDDETANKLGLSSKKKLNLLSI